MDENGQRTILIIGASRGIGRGLANEYLRRGWRVIATVRSPDATVLDGSVDGAAERLRVENLDMTKPEQIAALRDRIADEHLDVLFVNAGVSDGNVGVAEIDDDTFNEVMVTNALGPLRVVEALADRVDGAGTVAVMSSHQGSLALNDKAGYEVYRSSKSALNQLMRSYAVRHRDESRTLLLVAPGWVQTELGGPGAVLTVEESVAGIVDTLEARRGSGGFEYLDYRGQAIPW